MISVIIATYNRSQYLNKLLTCLYNQTVSIDLYEVIVVDDGSVDDTFDLLKKYKKKFSNFKYCKQPNSGPAVARNQGINRAIGKYIAFIDDDCLPANNWIELIKKTFFKNENIAGIEGATFTKAEAITPFTEQIENTVPRGVYPTCNIAYKANLLKLVGGFDENFPFAHNEDIDLAWRVIKFGKIIFCKRMIVFHPPRRIGLVQLISRGRKLISEFYLYNKFKTHYTVQRAKTPWINIYVRYLFVFKFGAILRWTKKWEKPWFLVFTFVLFLFELTYLIMMIPKFKKAEKKYQKE
jgi:glycosyltransferase involved in cell wall biosynthesis